MVQKTLERARKNKTPIEKFDAFIRGQKFQEKLAQLSRGEGKQLEREIAEYRKAATQPPIDDPAMQGADSFDKAAEDMGIEYENTNGDRG